MKPPPASLGKFDLIFLRNVLIYFDHDTKKQVVERLLSALKQADIFHQPFGEPARYQRTAAADKPVDIPQTVKILPYKGTRRIILDPGEYYASRQAEVISTLLVRALPPACTTPITACSA